MRSRNGILVLAVAGSLLPCSVRAQKAEPPARQSAHGTRGAMPKGASPACRVEGIWQLESVNWSGQVQPMTGTRERKMLTQGRFMFIGADAKRDTIALRTAADTLRSQQVIGGTGSYKVSGDTYTEHLELFFIPTWEGRDVPAKCQTDGDRWTHTWHADTATVVEVWRRIR